MKGSTIKQKLAQTGTSQKGLARLLGVSPQSVLSVLRGKDVRTGTLERICQVLNLPITYFYDEEGEERPETLVPLATNAPSDQNLNTSQKIWETDHIGEKVRSLLREQHKSLAGLCEYIGMTDPGLRKVFVRDTCNINTLKKIAKFFSVPVAYFLPEDPKIRAEAEKNSELEFLRGQVKAYETALRLLAGERGTEPPLTVVK